MTRKNPKKKNWSRRQFPRPNFDKLPVAWLQLKHQKTRLLIALLGVVFAVVIVFMQLGIKDALFDSSVRLYQALEGDCFLISPRTNALIALEGFSQRRLTQALAFPEVEFVSPIYLGYVQWKNPQTRNYWRNIFVIGIEPDRSILNLVGVSENISQLKIPDQILFDVNSRQEFGNIEQELSRSGQIAVELSNNGSNRKVKVVGLFQLGTSFGADGNILTTDLNFLRIFGDRPKGFINLGLIKLKFGTNIDVFLEKVKSYLPKDVKVFSKAEIIQYEQKYWNSSTPIGFIFSLGVGLGVIVGVVIVYQILYANVSEHLAEYATLKAMGYEHKYLLMMVLQQSVIIAVLGFIPGFLLSAILYEVAKGATLLPFAMSPGKIIMILLLTITMCFVSGVIAIGKLRSADPADIF
jgi:putative ABC transport system permease protein